MSNEAGEYREAVIGVLVVARALNTIDIPELLDAITRANSVGHILDPTLYREKSKAMNEDAELLRAALPLWRFVREHYATHRSDARERAAGDGME